MSDLSDVYICRVCGCTKQPIDDKDIEIMVLKKTIEEQTEKEMRIEKGLEVLNKTFLEIDPELKKTLATNKALKLKVSELQLANERLTKENELLKRKTARFKEQRDRYEHQIHKSKILMFGNPVLAEELNAAVRGNNE